MAEISIILSLIKLTGSMIYFVLMLFGREEKLNKVVRLILAIVILILNIIAVSISISTGKTLNVSMNVTSVFIWITLTLMGIANLRD